MFGKHFVSFAEKNHSSNCVMELAQIAGPIVTQKLLHGRGMNRDELLAGRARLCVQFPDDQAGEVLDSLPQRGDEQRHSG